jgi:hypothetical protein
MNTKQKNKSIQLPWPLILSLAAVALVRPVVKVFGDVFNYDVSPLVTILLTVAIAGVWIGVAVKLKVKKPVLVLAVTGVVYAVSSIAMAVIIQLVAPDLGDGEAQISVLLTAGLIATTIFNVIYGGFLGFVASLIQKAATR